MITEVRRRRENVVPVAAVDIEDLYRREAARLLGMLVVFVGDRSEAEDVVHEAFVRVQRSLDRIEDPARAGAYLRSVAFNLARSQLRRRGRVRMWADRPAPTPVEEGCSMREDQREVAAALAALPERQRACVVLRHFAGDGIDDIAASLGISPNSVKTHLRRAMATLHTRLEPLQ